jgi:hypothetical protein
MVSKCANPDCSTPFHYLREGKVFRIEMEEISADALKPFVVGAKKAARKVEHFWLCGPCSRTMKLIWDKDHQMTVVPKDRPLYRRAAAAS